MEKGFYVLTLLKSLMMYLNPISFLLLNIINGGGVDTVDNQ